MNNKDEQGHVHAALMMEYAEIAKTSKTPWKEFEYRHGLDRHWCGINHPPNWYDHVEYRRKPKTININGFEVPEPLLEFTRDRVWVVDFAEESLVYSRNYYAFEGQAKINLGICHSTREDAELHAKALLSFTKRDRMS